MANIVRKAIVFNLDDPYQKRMYEHVKRFKNFSFYGKSLIQEDMKNWDDEGLDRKPIRKKNGGIEFKMK